MSFDSGGHVTFAVKLVELNLFVWILYYSRDHYIGDEDKKWKRTCYRSLIVSLIQRRLAPYGRGG